MQSATPFHRGEKFGTTTFRRNLKNSLQRLFLRNLRIWPDNFRVFPSLANHVRNILRSGERSRRSDHPVCLSALGDVTRCVKLSLALRARRATPVSGTP